MLKVLSITAVSILVVIGLFYFFWLRPFMIAGNQVRNYATMQFYMHCLDRYQEQHGEYPQEVSTALDSQFSQYPREDEEWWYRLHDIWGNAYHYESDGVHYLLASLGRDGSRDIRGWPALGARPAEDKSPCYNRNFDTVVTDLGIHQACTK